MFTGTARAGRIELRDGTRLASAQPPGADGAAVTCAVRSEKILLEAAASAGAGSEDANALTGRVLRHIFAGSSLTYLVDWGGESLKVFVQNRTGEVVPEGAEVRLSWSPGDTVVVSP